MKKESYYSLAEEVLTSFLAASSPLDSFLAHFFRKHRFLGATDRRSLAEFLYFVIRQQGALEALCQQTQAPPAPLARLLIVSAVGVREATLENLTPTPEEQRWLTERLLPGSSRLDALQQENCPAWCRTLFEETFGTRWPEEVAALQNPAPVDLRVHPGKITRQEVLRMLSEEGISATLTPYSPWGVRLAPGVRLSAGHLLLRSGQMEIQEEGAQLVSLLLPVSPGATVVDYCAGAGGKTLVLAHRLQNRGVLYAVDVSSQRLERARLRLRRAGASKVRMVDLSQSPQWVEQHQKQGDLVVVDVPCSGTGTWRRNPDAKRRLTPAGLQETCQKQQEILHSASTLVRPGGLLAYITCSLWKTENENQVEHFLRTHSDFVLQEVAPFWQQAFSSPCIAPGPFLFLTPAQHSTNGFFLALFERKVVRSEGFEPTT
ncbi:MAG: RsmB/NOP family class I SAM-dependent RNA methyltransferase [Holosporales bacterium]|nr:RsmB/NOP family class I SAM-dependent RNA methyltransferase [Holosporales bacterium]